MTTGIRVADDPRCIRAEEAVRKLDSDLMRYWEDKRAGRDPDAEARYERAGEIPRRLGLSYAPAQEAASGLPVEDILRRIETLEARGTVEREPEVSTVLGGEETPIFRVSSMVDEFERIVAEVGAAEKEVARPKG